MNSSFEKIEIQPSLTYQEAEFKWINPTVTYCRSNIREVLDDLPKFKISKRHSRRKRKEIRKGLIQDFLLETSPQYKELVEIIAEHIRDIIDGDISREIYS